MVFRTALALVAVAHRQRSGLLPGKTAGRARRHALASLIEERFETALREECGVRGGDVLVALVSGGSDSVAMLFALHEVRRRWEPQLEVEALHFNHGLRIESEAESTFVRALCARLETPCNVRRWTGSRGPTQSTAREWRRRTALEVLGKRRGHIVLGHHADDQLETSLMRLARGGRLTHVFRGMQTYSRPCFARPFLGTSKDDLVEYLRSRGETWVEDSSNADSDKYARNKARHEVVPGLRDLARGDESLRQRFAALAQQSRAFEAWTRSVTDECEAVRLRRLDCSLAIADWHRIPQPVRFELLSRVVARASGSASFAAILDLDDALVRNNNTSTTPLVRWFAGGVVVRLVGDRLRAEAGNARPASFVERMVADVHVQLPDTTWTFAATRTPSATATPLRDIPAGTALQLRFRRPGDRFHPAWRARPIKVKDFLRGQRVPLADRDVVPLLVRLPTHSNADDTVVALFVGDIVHVSQPFHVRSNVSRYTDDSLLWIHAASNEVPAISTTGGASTARNPESPFRWHSSEFEDDTRLCLSDDEERTCD